MELGHQLNIFLHFVCLGKKLNSLGILQRFANFPEEMCFNYSNGTTGIIKT